MRRFTSILSRPEFHVLTFFTTLIVFARPVMLMLEDERAAVVVLSFFLPWAAVVGILYAASRSYRVD
jgi:hypothetical protein